MMALTKRLKKTAIPIILLTGFLLCLSPARGAGASYYAVQLAASKSPLNISAFAKNHQIEEGIREIAADGWYRYVVGKFENLSEASRYAAQIALEAGISGAFPREIPEQTSASAENSNLVTNQEQPSAARDSVSESTPKTLQPEPPKVNQEQVFVERTPHKELNDLILKIVGDKNVNQTKRELIEYGKEHFPVPIRKIYNRFIEKTYTYPIVLIFVLLIFVFVVNVSIVLFVIYESNKYQNKKERYRMFYKNYYEEVLSLYLFDINDWETTLSKLKRLGKPENRRILTSVLLVFKENLRGEMDAKITEIFIRLDLNKDAIRLTRSFFYYKKVQGIRELTNLDPEKAKAIIEKFLNHKHHKIRTEAQVSYVRLHPESPFAFLKDIKSPFSPWTQLSSFYTLRLHQIPVPNFAEYIDSGQSTIRNFCLRMIIFFQQFEAADKIFNLIENKLESTRNLSIRAANDLRLYDGKRLLLGNYEKESDNNKLEIIKALKNVGDETDFPFLENIILNGTASQRIEACRSLYQMSRLGQQCLEEIGEQHNINLDLYLAHIKDPRN